MSLRLGIIGAGFIARFQVAGMKHVRGIEITGVTSHAGSEALCGMIRDLGLGTPAICRNVTELVRNADCIAIFAPNFTRLSIVEEIVAAVRAGHGLKGVICEKPLGRTVAEARRLVELADAADLRTAYFENQLFMKPVTAQLAQLEPVQKRMGPMTLTRCSEEHAGPHEPWFWDPRQQGGGVLSDMGCHSIAVGRFLLTPLGKELTYLEPQTVSAEVGLLKWGLPYWRDRLLKDMGVDYSKYPAEDFATGIFTYRNPETGAKVKSQFTNSWMFEKQGLRLFMDGTGPGYAFELNSLLSPLTIFVGDSAAAAVKDAQTAIEKATSTRGLLPVLYNEPDLYGYPDEIEDAVRSFESGKNGSLPWSYGLEVTRLVTAAYMAAETRRTVDLTDTGVQKELEQYLPLIQQGRGSEVLL
jgi:predicted dehydrogenase